MKIYILFVLMLLIVISIFMNDIEAFENNIATRATASRQVNLHDTVYTPNIKLHQIVGANDTVYEPSICFNLKNSNNQTVLSDTERNALASAGITDVNSMDRVCLTKKHFVSLYSIKSIMDQFNRSIKTLVDRARAIAQWKRGTDTNNIKLEDYLKQTYYPKNQVYSIEQSRGRFLQRATPDNPYLTETTGDLLFERREGKPTNLSDYYLTRTIGDSKYAPINSDYISVAELNELYEPTGQYMSENILTKHMDTVSTKIIEASTRAASTTTS